eukprot:782815-Pleurochrysis_carterae.AAC.2
MLGSTVHALTVDVLALPLEGGRAGNAVHDLEGGHRGGAARRGKRHGDGDGDGQAEIGRAAHPTRRAHCCHHPSFENGAWDI